MGIMIMPLPPIALDLLLVTSISVALLVFLLTVYAKRPIDFSVFPKDSCLSERLRNQWDAWHTL